MSSLKLNFVDGSSTWYEANPEDYHVDNDGYVNHITLWMKNGVPMHLVLIHHNLKPTDYALGLFRGGMEARSGQGLLETLRKWAGKAPHKWVGNTGILLGTADAVSRFISEHKLLKKEGYYDENEKLIVSNIIKTNDPNSFKR